MKQFKFYALMLFCILLSINQVWADEVVYNFSSFTSAQDVELHDNNEIITIGLHKREGGSSPAWVSNEARVYAKGSLVISSEQTITSIVFAYTVNANKSGTVPTIDGVSGATNAGQWNAETKTWTGSDTEVTFSTSGTAGNVGFTSITVTYGGGPTYTDYLTECAEGTKTIYLKPASIFRSIGNEKLAVYDNTHSKWVDFMTQMDGCNTDYWACEIPESCTSVIFGRFAQNATQLGWNWSYPEETKLINQSVTVNLGEDNCYSLTGWDNGNANGSLGTFVEKYSVTFSTTQGVVPESQCVANGGMVSNPDVRVAGYRLDGWYSNSSFTGSPWNFETNTITSETTLYAKWTAVANRTIYLKLNSDWANAEAKYAIYYFTNGTGWSQFMTKGMGCYDGYYYTEIPGTETDVNIVRLAPSKQATGNWDDKWNQTVNLEIPDGKDKVTITTQVSGGDDNGKYNATWDVFSVETYSITFNGNGSTEGSMSAINSIPCGESRDLTSNAFRKEGHTFAGWATTADGSVVYSDNATLSDITSDVELFAKWNVNFYTLTWCLDGGSTSATEGSEYTAGGSVAFGADITYPADNTMSKDGYHFTGWSSTPSTMSNGNLTLTAQWEINSYDVKWYVNGVEYENGGSTSVKHGAAMSTLTLPTAPEDDALFCKDKFMGWSETDLGKADGQDAPSDLFTSVAGKATVITEAKEFYAVFADAEGGVESNYTITFANNASSATGLATSTRATTFIAEASRTYVTDSPISSVENSYYGDNKTSIRVGKSGAAGSVVLTLSETGKVDATKITVNTNRYNNSNAATLSVNGTTAQDIPESADDLEFELDGSQITSITLSTSKYAYVNSITVTSGGATYSNYVTRCCTPLAAPTGLAAVGTTHGITFNWTKAANATGYRVTFTDGETPVDLEVGDVNTVSTTVELECGGGTDYTWSIVSLYSGAGEYCAESEAANAAEAVRTAYCACDNYSFHYGTKNADDWNNDNPVCFAETEIADGFGGHLYFSRNFTMPNKPDFNVAWAGAPQGYTETVALSGMSFYLANTKTLGTISDGSNVGAIGTLVLHGNYNSQNKLCRFVPGGYVLKIGEHYDSYAFQPADADNVLETVWTTDLMTLDEDMLTHKIQVLLKTATGSVWSPNMSSDADVNGNIGQKSGAETWGTNLSAADAGKQGKFRIWADNSAANWSVHFVPFVQATFDANGGSCGSAVMPAERVSVEAEAAARTITLPEATKIGHSLLWSDGANTYAAGAEVELTADMAFTAQWTAESYGITYHLNDGEWDGEAGAANYIYGTGVGALADNVERDGYRFDGWYAASDFSGGVVNSIAADVLGAKEFWAKWTRVYTITYTIPTGGGSLAGGYAETVAEGETFTMPNVTGIDGAYECETFIGWTTTAPTTANGWENEAKPAIFYQAGETSPAITEAPVLYAVYSRPGCGEAGTASLNGTHINGWYDAGKASNGSIAYGIERTTTDNSGTRTWTTTGYQQGSNCQWLNLKSDGSPYILMPAMPGNIRTITITCSNGSDRDLTSGSLSFKATSKGEAVATHDFSSVNNIATFDLTSGEYTGGYIYTTGSGAVRVKGVIVEYGPAPVVSHALSCASCAVEQFSLNYDANTANFSGSNITCSNETDYVFAEHDNEYTICDGAGEWTGWKFVEWNTQADGNGTSYTAGRVITPASLATDDLTLYAIWERVYDVTFHDAGVDTKRTQEHNGSEVSVPAARLSSLMTFVGWTTDSKVLQGEIVKPTIALAADVENYTPTADVEFYAVYKKAAASSAFAEKTASTTYAVKIRDNAEPANYATGAVETSGTYADGNSTNATVFYITYVGDGTEDSKIYTVQTDCGYLKGDNGTNFVTQSTPANWTITSNNSGALQMTNYSGRYFGRDNGGFKNYSGTRSIYFETADGIYYWSNQPHAINLSATTNGSIAVQGGLTEAAEGSTVTVIATQEPGYALQTWSFSGDASHGSLTEYTTTFVMGTTDVTVGATFERAAQVTATFYVNGVEHSQQTKYQGESIELPTAITSTDDDYVTFLGWSDGAQFTDVTAEPEILTGTKQLNATKNYYAVFTDMVVSRAKAGTENGTDVLVYNTTYVSSSEKTSRVGGVGVEYAYRYVLNNSNGTDIQFQKSATTYGYIYNTTSLGKIVKVEVSGADVPVYACSAANTKNGGALTKQGTPANPRTYIMPDNTEFFLLQGDNSYTYHVTEFKVYYLPNGGSQHYTTNFCPKRTITITPVSGATLTASKDAACQGKTVTVTATVNPGNEFGGWTSSEVTFTDASALTTTFTMPDQAVTISATINSIKMTGMTLNQTEVVWSEWKSDAVAPSQQLSVTSTTPAVVGDNTVTWSVTSGSAVTVSATGLVTAVEAGTATVTATANDGSGVTASCTFTVPEKQWLLTLGTPTGLELYTYNGSRKTAKKQYFTAGTVVNIGATENGGYGFTGWNITGATPAADTKTTTITMPAAEVSVNATSEMKEDTYIDDMHSNATRTLRGPNYTVPVLRDNDTGDDCEVAHYHFVGWIEEQYLEADGAIDEKNVSRIFSGGTQNASGKTYYAIWVEEDND